MIDKKTAFENNKETIQYFLKHPSLYMLFYELTLNCNEHCKHCGSSAGDACISNPLTADEFNGITDQIAEDFADRLPRITITGGEPLLRRDFFDIVNHIADRNISWGMTTNGTLITPDVARDLNAAHCSALGVSIDGLRDTHDDFRQHKGGYDKTMKGVEYLIKEGFRGSLIVTTVCTHKSVRELPELFKIIRDMKIDSWRIINMDPIGRANDHPDLIMTPDDLRYMFDFMKEKRHQDYSVMYGCAHYLGYDWEYETRDFGFRCLAGNRIASVTIDGKVTACLDIIRNPDIIQGDVRERRFKDIWDNEFKLFRDPEYKKCEKCEGCSEWDHCLGDAFHTWNFKEHRPNVCYKDVLGF